jgi:tetratricopeptide (TPR) repeat protein
MKRITAIMAAGLVLSSAAAAQSASPNDALPLTTRSARVLRLLDQAWKLESDQVEDEKAIEVLRKIVKLDPDFALGHEILVQISLDPAEQVSEQEKAFARKSHATPAEQTVIDWFQNAADHKLIAAIMSMNEVLRQYPHDRWVVFLANYWLMSQTQYQRAAEVYENSGLSSSPGLVNDAAYTYAYMREFDRAFALMDKYVSLMPRAANPQDSYAEILRMAGHYQEAIEHFRAALALNPRFYSSEFGIADTYALMGDENRARRQYRIAFRKFPSMAPLNYVQWRTREATTYVRDGDFSAAERAFQAIAEWAHARRMSQVEADTYRQMAMFKPQEDRALALLDKAEGALRARTHASPTHIQQEAAQILRARVELALKVGDQRAAEAALGRLAALAEGSNDKMIDSAYHGALGARLSAQLKYNEAVEHLEEDANNPWSLDRLARAYRETGDVAGAKHTDETLANLNDPTLDQALVVPGFRKCLENPSCDTSMRTVTLSK